MAKCVSCGKFMVATGTGSCSECIKKPRGGCKTPSKKTSPEKKSTVCPSRETSDESLYSDQLAATSCQNVVPPLDGADVQDMRHELAEFIIELRKFRSEFRASIEGMGHRMDNLERRLESVEQRESSTTTHVEDLQRTVVALRQELNDREQEALLCDLDIGHLPEEKNENVHHTNTLLGIKLGVTLEERDIVFAERIGTTAAAERDGVEQTRARPRRVVVRLACRRLRDELLRAARVRRTLTSADVGLAGPPRRLYLNERLTKANRVLFHLAREKCANAHWRFSWTKRGRIYVRKSDGTQVFPVRTTEELERVFN